MSYKNQILELRKAGQTYNQIVKALGCSKATVSYHCTNEGVPRPKRVPAVPEDREEVARWLLAEGARLRDIADAMSLPEKDVQRFAREQDLVRNRTPDMTAYERVHRRRRHLKMLAVVYLGGCCSLCGYRKCFQALDFHHLDPTLKDFAISQNTNRAWANLKNEVAKCQLLCANCHREKHALEE